MKSKILEIRKEIDELDTRMFLLLKERFNKVKRLSKIKKENKLRMTDIKRQKEIIERINKKYKTISSSFIENIFQIIFKYSKTLQSSKQNRSKIRIKKKV